MKSVYQFGDKLIILPEIKATRCDETKVIVEYRARPVYVYNPGTLKYEREILVDLVTVSFENEKEAISQYLEFCNVFHAYISWRYQ